MSHIIVSYIGGPLDGQEKAIEQPVPKHEYHEVVTTDKDFVQLRRYTLTEAGEYRYDLKIYSDRSPFSSTYPGGKTLEDLIQKFNKE